MKIHPWMLVYILQRILKPAPKQPKHIFLCVCDHFEPLWRHATDAVGLERVRRWIDKYPKAVAGIKDAEGCGPKHTFFYPIEEYRPQIMKELAAFCKSGFGEVEVHLHHDNDTSENLRKTLTDYKSMLFEKHGLLCKDKQNDQIKYGFIHGNWALDNSRPDGRMCGVNDELRILEETGCYTDFTMPSAPDVTQTAKINSIYYAIDDPKEPKSHNKGIDAQRGVSDNKGLLIVQGPLVLNFSLRKWGILPRIENGDLSHTTRVSAARLRQWIKADIGIKNLPGYVFIKLYTHGCQEQNAGYLLESGLKELFSLVKESARQTGVSAHFFTAREMVNVIKALESGQQQANFLQARDYHYLKY